MKTIFRILVKKNPRFISIVSLIISIFGLIIAFWVLIIAFWGLYLKYNPRPEPALKYFVGYIKFYGNNPFSGKPSFIITIKNKGVTTQKLYSIQTDKGEYIHPFYSRKGESRESWFALDSYNKESIFLDITPYLLKKLKNTNGLFLLNNVKDKKKIISKKDIQKALKSYKTLK